MAKRKTADRSAGPIKKARTVHASAATLGWRRASRSVLNSAGSLDKDGAMISLDELDDVDVEWVTTDTGARVARFLVSPDAAPPQPEEPAFHDSEDEQYIQLDDAPEQPQPLHFDGALLPAYHHIPLHPALKHALLNLGFLTPTPIQEQALAVALAEKARDIIGISHTGSGKTLAYGLPILHSLINSLPPKPSSDRTLKALILCPTRELALQVKTHLSKVITSSSLPVTTPPQLSIQALVGGLSLDKQKRLLSKGADIIIATPGRLWDILSSAADEGAVLSEQISGLKFLVLDEADRMIQNGHFKELESILALTKRTNTTTNDPEFAADPENEDDAPATNEELTTYVYSATMSKHLQKNLKRYQRPPKSNASTLDDLLAKLDFRDDDPAVIHISTDQPDEEGKIGGAEKIAGLKECKIECMVTEKDLYLYHFLLMYPGRTLVFLPSIDGIRRLSPLLTLLNFSVNIIHSQMQQRARLKALDRFQSSKASILLATDVASRGLDVPSVDHVVHFSPPRTAADYIHRSGRTARAGKEGVTITLIAPEEAKLWSSMLRELSKKSGEVETMPYENEVLSRLRERIRLAKDIDKLRHGNEKKAFDKKWIKEAAEALEVDLSSDDQASDDDVRAARSHTSNKDKARQSALASQLKDLLRQPIRLRGISEKYITSGVGARNLVESLMDATAHDKIVGMKKDTALGKLKRSHEAKAERVKENAKSKKVQDVENVE